MELGELFWLEKIKVITLLDRLVFDFQVTKSGRHFQNDVLDGLRGLAVLLVLLSHLANENILLFSDMKFSGNGSGKIGVYIFFVLSSFLLTRILLRNTREGLYNPSIWKEYFFRRLLRIFPLYFVAQLVVFFGVSSGYIGFGNFDGYKSEDIVSHLLMLKGDRHFWSVATEVKYYLIVPLLIWVYLQCFSGSIKRIFVFTLCLLCFYPYCYPLAVESFLNLKNYVFH